MAFLDRLRAPGRPGRRAEVIRLPDRGNSVAGPEYEGDSETVDRYESAMVKLRDEHPPAPSELVDDILAYVFSVAEEDLPESRTRIRWFLIGGAVAATVVLAIVGVVLLRRGWVPRPPDPGTVVRARRRHGAGAPGIAGRLRGRLAFEERLRSLRAGGVGA